MTIVSNLSVVPTYEEVMFAAKNKENPLAKALTCIDGRKGVRNISISQIYNEYMNKSTQ